MSEDFQVWKNHFINQAKGLIPHQKRFYKVSMQQGGGSQPIIKMVSPTEQIVERAKSTLDQAPSVFDPVTGVMQQTKIKHVAPSRKRKRNPPKKKNNIKKRKHNTSKSKPGQRGKTTKKQKWS
jgi:hypothetical protein